MYAWIIALALAVALVKVPFTAWKTDAEMLRRMRGDADAREIAREIARDPGYRQGQATVIASCLPIAAAAWCHQSGLDAGSWAAGAVAAVLFVIGFVRMSGAAGRLDRDYWWRFDDYNQLSGAIDRAWPMSRRQFLRGPLRRYLELSAEAQENPRMRSRTVQFAGHWAGRFRGECLRRPAEAKAFDAEVEAALTRHFGPPGGRPEWLMGWFRGSYEAGIDLAARAAARASGGAAEA